MPNNLLASLSLFLLCSNLVHAADVRWDVGLTENREVIAARGVINNLSAATVLYVAGLDGVSAAADRISQLHSDYSRVAAAESTNLIVIPNANPDGDSLQFPPSGGAYASNTVSHVLWRWIGTQAPDLIIIEPGEDFGFSDAVVNEGIAGFGTIPVSTLSPANSSTDYVLASADIAQSPARAELTRRATRSPLEVAEQLAAVYGGDFSTPVYVPGMSVIGRLRLGDVEAVNELLAPYLQGQSFEISNASALAGQLVFAEHAVRTGSPESLELALRAADLAFDANGELLEVVPMHNEMSDSFFMATPLLAKAGALSGEEKYFDMAARHVSYMRSMLLRENRLYRHSPEADVAWSRGNGFPALGLALTLSDFPLTHPARDLLLGMLIDHLEALLPYQDYDGMWHEVIDYPGSFAEITSTAMIGIAIKRGLDRGWLSQERYRPVLDRAWDAVKIRTSFEGEFINACTSTGKMPTIEAYLDRRAIFGADDRAGGMVMNFAIEMAGLE